MIKQIMILFLFNSLLIFSQNLLNNSEICSHFKTKEKNEKKFNPYTGKTNINFKKDGIYKCTDVDATFRIPIPGYLYIEDLYISGNIIIEIKNRKMTKFEVKNNKTNQLLFSSKYNQYGADGEMYIYKSFGIENSHTLKMTYKNGKPVGDILEYYKNGNLYRKSHLIEKNNYHPYSTPDDYIKYVDYYEIYDINTGKILHNERLNNKTGKIIEYSFEDGRIYIEFHKRNGKTYYQRDYKKDGTIAREYHYNRK